VCEGLCYFWAEVVVMVWRVCDSVLKARLFFQQNSFPVNEMAEYEAEGELPRRRLGVKEQQNGDRTGKDKMCLKYS